MWRMANYSWLLLICLASASTANAASSSLPQADTPVDTSPSLDAARDTFQSVACNDQASSLPTLKQEVGKTLPKAAANGPRPSRLSRLRASTLISACSAFLTPDTLQIRDVRLQV
jgi:hypothetical protein